MMLVEDYIDRWKIWRFAILIVVFFFFYPGKNLHASPDNRYFYHLGVEDGLLQSSIFDISEDRYGYIWIATRHGLSRYDGKNFKNYRKAKIEGEYEIIGSVSNIVPCENGLWFNSSFLGLLWFDFASEEIVLFEIENLDKRFSASVTTSFYDKENGLLYMAKQNGDIYKYDILSGECWYIGRVEESIIQISLDVYGQIWFLCSEGIYRYDGIDDFIFIDSFEDEEGDSIMLSRLTYMVHSGGTLWLSSFNGIYKGVNEKNIIRSGKQYCYDSNDLKSLCNNIVRYMAIAPDGRLWAATGDGLAYYSNGGFEQITSNTDNPMSLNDKYVYSIFFDSSDNLWAGTYFGGINISYSNIKGYSLYYEGNGQTGLKGKIVKAFVENGDELWIGTEDAGISIWNRNTHTWRYFNTGNYLPSDNIQTLLKDNKGRIWIGTFRDGVIMYENNSFRYYTSKPNYDVGLCSNMISSLFLDTKGRVWASTFSCWANVFDEEAEDFVPVQNKNYLDVNIPAMFSYAGKVFFIQNTGRLFYVDDSLNVNEFVSTGREFFAVRSAFHSVNSVFISTFYDGVFVGKLSDKSVHFYNQFLPFETVNKVLPDKNENLWLSTLNSIYNFDNNGELINIYDQNDGLALNFNRDAGLLLSTGELVFGGTRGFCIIDPEEIVKNKYLSNIHISELSVNYEKANNLLYQQANNEKPLNFKYKQNNIMIGFINITYAPRHFDEYFYRLIGYNNEWVSNGSANQIIFNNLKHGEYKFEVITRTALESGNEQMKRTLAFNILTPWWLTKWAFSLYFAFSFVMIFIIQFIVLSQYRRRKMKQMVEFEQLKEEELNESKISFFTNITHEIRTPLTLIIGPLEEYINKAGVNKEESITLNIIRKNAYRLLNLVNQILDYRKYESKRVEVKLKPLNISDLIEEVKLMFSQAADLKLVNLKLEEGNADYWVLGDRSKLIELFSNLLSNAFKFTPKNGTIIIGLSSDDMLNKSSDRNRMIEVYVSDTGPGISDDIKDKIFTPFYSRVGGSDGFHTGIGLALVNEIVKLHNGHIDVVSGNKVGTTFKVFIPAATPVGSSIVLPSIDDDYKENFNLIEPSILLTDITDNNSSVELEKSELPIILVVEDNAEMRAFIKRCLVAEYQVVEAADGSEGLKIAKEIAPDLIISDISMPNMSGIEFCKVIKGHFSTSSTPFILLTVYGSVEKQIEGVETGADLYLTKPFHAGLIRQQIQNLLLQRTKIAEKIRHEILMAPDELDVVSEEDSFLLEVKSLVEKNIDNAGFGIDNLADDLGLSRTVLYRKFDQIIGLSPKDFIRQSRLKRAAQLLKAGQMNVSEVTYAVGYNDLRYFRESFFKHFGVNPSEYK